jgi:UDP-N-acetylmuramate dehydrogenase
MTLMSQIESIKEEISGKITFNENLSKLSWFNLGGPAQVLFRPKNLKELSIFLKKINGFGNIKIIGAGSNTLIRDGGLDGVIIKLGKAFSHLSMLNPHTIIAGASAIDKNVSKFASQNSLTGFEFLSCIPGSIGGAVKMNTGCYGENISNILISVQAIDHTGNIKVINAADIKFYYRGSDLSNDLIFISATFKGKKDKKKNIEKKINMFLKKKANTQPLKVKTCGSTFKNPKNKKAWELIQESGCIGMKIGDAQISDKHCNFFINNGKAKSEDLEKLILQVKDKVFKKTGIKLELEVQIIGKTL